MKRKISRKAFTLIELLAVILVLGIIALIAIPTITNIISESKSGAFKATVDNLTKAIENNCQTQKIKGDNLTKQYIFSEDGVFPTIEIKGKLPINGSAMLDDDCEVSISVSNGDFTINKVPTDDAVTILEGDVATLQVNKFYFDNAKKIVIYELTVPEESIQEEGLIELYGEELASLLKQTKKYSRIYYLDASDKLIAVYNEVLSFDISFGTKNMNRLNELITPFFATGYGKDAATTTHILTDDGTMHYLSGDLILNSKSSDKLGNIPSDLANYTPEQLEDLLFSSQDPTGMGFVKKIIEAID